MYRVKSMKTRVGAIQGRFRAYLGFNIVMAAICIAFAIAFYTVTEKALLPCEQGTQPVLDISLFLSFTLILPHTRLD